MINKIIGVIGANFGDEGKGQYVNDLIDDENSKNYFVVRYNGGAQAGHTVYHNGIRHVFSHFGAGTLKGANTILTYSFICNPNVFFAERQELINKGISPIVYVNDTCKITTPFDVIWNRCVEASRDQRHGSVGLGINATLERDAHFLLRVYDIDKGYEHIENRLKSVVQYYQTNFNSQYKIVKMFNDFIESIGTFENTCRAFYEKCVYFKNFTINMVNSKQIINDIDDATMIFEGAQGLQLTEKYGTMPYCTPTDCSITAIGDNISNFVGRLQFSTDALTNIDVYYVTRPYVTRHGNGPLNNEVQFNYLQTWFNIIDKTNVPNDYQGEIRYGLLNPSKIATFVANEPSTSTIERLYGTCVKQAKYNKHVVITCTDQIIGHTFPIISTQTNNNNNWTDRFDKDFCTNECINQITLEELKKCLINNYTGIN